MNRKVIIIGAIVAILIIGVIVMLVPGSSNGPGKRPPAFFEMFSRSGGEGQESVVMAGSSIDYNDFVSKLKSGEVSFVWELWAMRAKCDEAMSADQCDASILAYIEKHYSSPEKEKMLSLFKKYFQYEAEMRETDLGGARNNFNDRYDIIKKKRREILGKEDAELMFGMEEAQVDFAALGQRQINASKNLSGDERVKQYDALKKQTYGQYYDAIVKREDKFQNYSIEMSLREQDLAKLSDADRAQRVAALQEQYFGKDAAAAIAKAQAESAAEQKKLDDYEAKQKDFLAQNASLPEAEKQEKLKALRVQMLGEEEAAAYERRKQFEEAVSKIK